MSAGWLVGRCTAEDCTPQQQYDITTLARRYGLNPDQVNAVAVTSELGEVHKLHFSSFVRSEQGIVLDVARNQPVTVPTIVEVELKECPSWLLTMGLTAAR